MKRKKLLVIFFTFICMFAMAVPSFASMRASDQIRDYLVDVKSDNREIYIDFSVLERAVWIESVAKVFASMRAATEVW